VEFVDSMPLTTTGKTPGHPPHRPPAAQDHRSLGESPAADGSTASSASAIAFNGCIYNYPELRQRARGQGLPLLLDRRHRGHPQGLPRLGPGCVDRFKGMFAFAIQERDSGRVVLARDRFGIKPLYLAAAGPRLRFASSLPALLAPATSTPRSIRVGARTTT
jgi:asparagine synthase (glutamine-hydrolysing)